MTIPIMTQLKKISIFIFLFQWLKVADDVNQFSKDQILKYHGENFIVLKNKGNMISLEKSRSSLNKLFLPSVQPKDAGIYVCAVVNKKGFKIRRATLKVEGDIIYLFFIFIFDSLLSHIM